MGKAKETTKERVRANVCLHCDSAKHQRGLCCKHYMQFRRTMLALPKSQQRNFEREQIAAGNVLAAGQIRELTTDNPFREEVAR
jgi:hypothetical protein